MYPVVSIFFCPDQTIYTLDTFFQHFFTSNFFNMKSTFAKQRFMPLLSAFLLFVAFLFNSTSASAQVVDGDKSLNWMLEGQALSVLEAEVNLWVDGMQQGAYGTQGSPAWNNATNHIEYYKLIMDAIEKGSSVYVAVAESLDQITLAGPAGASGFKTKPNANPAVLNLLKQDATTLLTI